MKKLQKDNICIIYYNFLFCQTAANGFLLSDFIPVSFALMPQGYTVCETHISKT